MKQLDPGLTPAAIFPVGIAHYWMRNYEVALSQFQSTIQMQVAIPSPYFWMGATYLEKKEYQKAIDSFQKAVELTNRARQSHWPAWGSGMPDLQRQKKRKRSYWKF